MDGSDLDTADFLRSPALLDVFLDVSFSQPYGDGLWSSRQRTVAKGSQMFPYSGSICRGQVILMSAASERMVGECLLCKVLALVEPGNWNDCVRGSLRRILGRRTLDEARLLGIAKDSATTAATAFAKFVGLGEARPPGASKYRAATKSKLSESSGEIHDRKVCGRSAASCGFKEQGNDRIRTRRVFW